MACTNCDGFGGCNAFFLPLNDLMGVLNGKWTIRILLCLASEPKRFNEMRRCHGISPRMLYHELKELELNGIIHRTELPGAGTDELTGVGSGSANVFVYALSEMGAELIPIIIQLQKWGTDHRQKVLQRMGNLAR